MNEPKGPLPQWKLDLVKEAIETLRNENDPGIDVEQIVKQIPSLTLDEIARAMAEIDASEKPPG